MRITPKYVFFWGGYLSNWFISPFQLDGIVYNCVEQYMMAQKAQLFGDDDMHRYIMEEEDPMEQKALGRLVAGFEPKIWEPVCEEIVFKGVLAKFEQNEDIKKILLETENKILVEASPYDKIWGVGLGINDSKINNPKNWKGQNLLGKVLMKVRQELTENSQGENNEVQ